MAGMILETLLACPSCGGDRIRTLDAVANICICESCRYIFDNPRPAVEELVRFYSQPTKYDAWLAEEAAREKLWARRLKLLRPVMKGGSLLDVGAGIGQFLNLARPYFASVQGTEVSESALEIARKKYGLCLRRGEIQAIDFDDQRFDNITIFHVLEHVPNPRLVLLRCAELLAPGGVLVTAVPNDVQSLRSRARRLLVALGKGSFSRNATLGLPRLTLDGSNAEIHLSHFTAASLQKLVERCGFSVSARALDPYYTTTGPRGWKSSGFYQFCRAVNAVFGMNLYDTILMVARMPGSSVLHYR